MRGRYKALWWSFFAIGGMVAALLYPAHVLFTLLLGPSGVIEMPSHEEAKAVFLHPLFRMYLVVLIGLPLLHAAHRINAAFMDFGLRRLRNQMAFLLYGGALAGVAFTIFTVFTM